MASKMYAALSATIFALVATIHALRLVLDLPVQVGAVEVPVAISWIGVPFALALSVWGYRSASRGVPEAPSQA